MESAEAASCFVVLLVRPLRLREQLLGEAEASGFSAGELEELTQAAEFAWA